MRQLLILLLFSVFHCANAQDSLAIEINLSEVYEFISFTDTSGGINLDMVAVKGGAFQMGSSNSDEDERPIHRITVSDFYIGKFEVTQAQWQAIMGNNLSCKNRGSCPDCPIECISWIDVQEYIIKLNKKTGKTYRLPTEAEWEYAAGGGNADRNKWAGFDNIESIDSFAWYYLNSNSTSHSIGQKQPNQLGLYDLSGNIYEWCSDWYSDSYYNNSPDTNPGGASFGSKRVIRGGSWGRSSSRCRVANRDFYSPANSYDLIGFRLALSVK